MPRSFHDVDATRKAVFDNTLNTLGSKYPLENEQVKLELADLRYDRAKPFSIADEKKAILNQRTLDWPIKGKWRLTDKKTDQVLSESDKVVGRVPYLTRRGTYILGGSEYVLSNQQRLRPGIYSRRKDNGEIESHVNVEPGSGRAFRLNMNPKNGVFQFRVGQANIPAYSVLRSMGVDDEQMKARWGEELYNVNREKGRSFDLSKIYDRIAPYNVRKTHSDPEVGLRAAMEKMRLDPEVSKRTLGEAYDHVSGPALMRAVEKVMNVSRGTEEPDDRDSQANQLLYGAEDIIPERIAKDAGQLNRQLLWKLTRSRDTNKVPSSYLTRQILSSIQGSGLGQPLTQVNPVETLDHLYRVTRMGEGGIPSDDSVPAEAKSVQPSQLGLIDIVKTPESARAGVDARASYSALKGEDNSMYRPVKDVRTGETRIVSAQDLTNSVLAFPGEMNKVGEKKVKALRDGKIRNVSRDQVDFELPSGNDMFSPASNLVPGASGVKGQRLSMGARMIAQALPMRDGEAPLMQSQTPDGQSSFETELGESVGVVRARKDKPGTVVKVDPDQVVVDYDGEKVTHELYNNFPFNSKTSISNTPTVKPGDSVEPGQMLAKSNYSDDEGRVALGRNLRVAFLPYEGNYEDGIVISESAAEKLSSEHMYSNELDVTEDGIKPGFNRFISEFPAKYSKKQLETMDEDGVAKPGTVVTQGDPLVLAVKEGEPPKGYALGRHKKRWNQDASQVWDHENEGVVTDVGKTQSGYRVAVKSYSPTKVADKLSSRYGAKGVASRIVPDDQMPRQEDGTPFEVIFNPMGLISRTNASNVIEPVIGKAARKDGKAIAIPAFTDENLSKWALKQAQDRGLKDTERVWDPSSNRYLNNVLTGDQWVMKLHHMAENKLGARDQGGYTIDDTPAKGSKRLGGLDNLGLMSHNATEVMKDGRIVRGQRNEDFWNRLRMGYPAPPPRDSMVWDKYLNTLRGAGVNVTEEKGQLHLSAMTDEDVQEMAGDRELQSGDAISLKDQSPIKGGLFDLGLTGGRDGNRWSKITLAEPMPHPLMEEPIRRLLGHTQKSFREELRKPGGGKKIAQQLEQVDLDEEIRKQKETIKSGAKSKRDGAVKLLRFLDGAKKTDTHPSKWTVSQVPVLPPKFRPVSLVNGMELTSDSNLLYKELFEANQNLKSMKEEVDDVGEEREAVYDALRASIGVGDPTSQELKQKKVAGMLSHLFGKGSSKFGMFQRKLMSTPVDSVGRGVIVPNTKLNMDQVGVPEKMAWEIYRPHIMRRLAKRYNSGSQKIPLTELSKWIEDKDPRAKQALGEEMKDRPVFYSRAPVLHKYGIMGGEPVLVPGNQIQMSPINTKGFGADFDGDTVNIHVPATDGPINEIREKMLPSRTLLGAEDFESRLSPSQEYLMGLYLATQDPDKSKQSRVFASEEDVVNAMIRGDINVNDPVTIQK